MRFQRDSAAVTPLAGAHRPPRHCRFSLSTRDSGTSVRVIAGVPWTPHKVIRASPSTFKFLSHYHASPHQLRGSGVTLNAFDLVLF